MIVWLEALKLVVSALVPLVVVLVGWGLSKRLKALEQAHWTNQKLIERRLQLFDDIMPRLNDMYCFYNFVGNWKEITPADIIAAKRYLDKKIHVYAPLLGHPLLVAYEEFGRVAFETYGGTGADARIRTVVAGFDGDRRIHCKYSWDSKWDVLFPMPATYDKTAFQEHYQAVEAAFQQAIGIAGHSSLQAAA
jgi:hypothetical protein